MGYRIALMNHRTPTVICCSRSTIPALEHAKVDEAMKGAYTISGHDTPLAATDLILIGTGSEVAICVEAASKLTALKVRVVSMPCQEIFLQQPIDYQCSVLPGNVPTLSVEASSVHGWHRLECRLPVRIFSNTLDSLRKMLLRRGRHWLN